MCRLPLPAAHLPLSHGDGGKKGRENLFLNSLVKFIEAHDAALLLMSMLLILVLHHGAALVNEQPLPRNDARIDKGRP